MPSGPPPSYSVNSYYSGPCPPWISAPHTLPLLAHLCPPASLLFLRHTKPAPISGPRMLSPHHSLWFTTSHQQHLLKEAPDHPTEYRTLVTSSLIHLNLSPGTFHTLILCICLLGTSLERMWGSRGQAFCFYPPSWHERLHRVVCFFSLDISGNC